MRHATRWIPLLFVVAACAETSGPGNWTGPVTDAVNPDWPKCTASSDCRWSEKCALQAGKADGACTRNVDGVPLAKDFTLRDRNPASATYDRDVTLSGLTGDIVVVYFALST